MTTTAQEVQTTQVYQVYIRATPEQIWDGITKPEHIEHYFHGCRMDGPLEGGGRWVARSPDLTKLWIDSEIIEFDPPRRLQHPGARSTTRTLRSRARAVSPGRSSGRTTAPAC